MNRNGVGFGGRRALRRLLAAVGATVAAVSLSSASVAGSPHAEFDAIENDILRPQFEDARIHFAINCASVGCPLLANEAYEGARLDEQLDAACRRALNDPRWVRVEGKNLVLTKIFDWYRDDSVSRIPRRGSVPVFPEERTDRHAP